MNNKQGKESSHSISFMDSIKTKLILLMALLVAVPLIIAILVSYNSSTRKDKADALKLLAANAKIIETKFSEVMNENISSLETFATAPSTVNYMQKAEIGEEPSIPGFVMLAHMNRINDIINDGNN